MSHDRRVPRSRPLGSAGRRQASVPPSSPHGEAPSEATTAFSKPPRANVTGPCQGAKCEVRQGLSQTHPRKSAAHLVAEGHWGPLRRTPLGKPCTDTIAKSALHSSVGTLFLEWPSALSSSPGSDDDVRERATVRFRQQRRAEPEGARLTSRSSTPRPPI